MGGFLGESCHDLKTLKAKLKRASIDELELYSAEIAILEMKPAPDEHGSYGFGWERKSAAIKALDVANAAIQAAKDNRPLPNWALKALAAGWTMPDGWKP